MKETYNTLDIVSPQRTFCVLGTYTKETYKTLEIVSPQRTFCVLGFYNNKYGKIEIVSSQRTFCVLGMYMEKTYGPSGHAGPRAMSGDSNSDFEYFEYFESYMGFEDIRGFQYFEYFEYFEFRFWITRLCTCCALECVPTKRITYLGSSHLNVRFVFWAFTTTEL